MNFLIEKKVLDRIPEGVIYTEKGMEFIETEARLLRVRNQPLAIGAVGNEATLHPAGKIISMRLMRCSQAGPKPTRPWINRRIRPDRPPAGLVFIRERGPRGQAHHPLGDDDSTSVAVAYLYLGVFPEDPHLVPISIAVADIDQRVLAGIETVLIKKGGSEYNHVGLPGARACRIDRAIRYGSHQAPLFARRHYPKALGDPFDAAIGGPGLLSFAHRSAEETLVFQRKIASWGWLSAKYPRFNFYEGSDILGNTTQMLRLISTSDSHTLVSQEEYFLKPLHRARLTRHALRLL